MTILDGGASDGRLKSLPARMAAVAKAAVGLLSDVRCYTPSPTGGARHALVPPAERAA